MPSDAGLQEGVDSGMLVRQDSYTEYASSLVGADVLSMMSLVGLAVAVAATARVAALGGGAFLGVAAMVLILGEGTTSRIWEVIFQ